MRVLYHQPMMPPPRTIFLLVAIPLANAGCGTIPVTTFGEVDAVDELLLSGGVTAARPVPGHQLLAEQGDAIFLLVEGEDPVSVSDVDDTLLGAAVYDGELLVLTEDGLSVVAAEDLAVTPLAAALDAAPDELTGAGDSLWMRVDDALWLLRGDQLGTVAVPERVFTGPLAAGIAPNGASMAWIGAEDRLVGVDVAGNVRVDRELAVTRLAADLDGVWAIVDGELVRGAVEGGWRRYALPAEVADLAADPGAAGAWVRAGDEVFHVSSDGVTETFDRLDVGLVPVGMATDPLGRLVAWNEDLHRVTAGRVVEVLGLEDLDVVDVAATVTILPTSPEEVDWVAVTVDDGGLDVTQNADGSWSARVDAIAWADGERHTLVATASYTSGAAVQSASLRFTAGAVGDATWSEHVEPIYVNECAVCHAGDTATLLNSPAVWQDRIEDILQQVETGAMPLADDPLTDGEIAVITAWRDGGFQP